MFRAGETADLVPKAKGVTKQADRAVLYARARFIAEEEAPWMTIAHSVRFVPCARKCSATR